MNAKPKRGLRLLWAKLLCHWFGHKPMRIGREQPRMTRTRVTIGEGCVRCETGTTKTFVSRHPRLREVRLDVR